LKVDHKNIKNSKNHLKIAVIIPNDFSVVWFCEVLVKNLMNNNEVTIISDIHDGYEHGHYLQILKKWGVRHKYVEFYRFINPFKDLKYIISLYGILNKENFDMVMNISTKPNLYGSIAAKLANVNKIVCSVWGLGLAYSDNKSIKNSSLMFIANILYRHAFKVSDKIWFTNINDYNYFLSIGMVEIKKKTILTKNYVNTEQFSPSAVCEKKSAELKRNLGYVDTDKIVIMLSRLSWAKGVKQFCEASDLLRDENPSVKFLLVGPEDVGSLDSVPLSFLQQYECHTNFSWIGFRRDVKELYSISYLAVYPSYYREGGYPRGLTEPMSMGKPVITTNSEHCSASVDDGISGILVPIKDSVKLAEAIKKIINNESLAITYGKKSREKAIKELDETTIIGNLVKEII